jgi:sec-independent protein translocase protein TatC
VSIEQLKNVRPYFIVGAFIVAAIVTPPDVLSQLLLAAPMCLLYELGILAARFIGKRKPEDEDEFRPLAEPGTAREPDKVEAEENSQGK